MKATRHSILCKTSSADLLELRRQLDDWRRLRKGREPLPDDFWALAVTLAEAHGVSRAARVLGLSFYKLRERVAAGAATGGLVASPPSTPGGFIELPLPAAHGPGGGCVVEFCGGGESRMRIRLSGEGPALVALAEAFWRRGR